MDDGDGNRDYALGSEPNNDVGLGSDEEPAVVESEEEEEASFVFKESSSVNDDSDWEEEERNMTRPGPSRGTTGTGRRSGG